MKNLPVSSVAFVWTEAGPKIVRTDACGEMAALTSFRRGAPRAGAKMLPESLLRLASVESRAPESGAAPLI